LKTIKAKDWKDIPVNYTGIVESEKGELHWFKAHIRHREDGPAIIWIAGDKEWYLNGKCIWESDCEKIDLRNKIILSKDQHPEYPTVQVWKYIDENGIREQIMIPGMEDYIIE